jgi:hypothetical protein
MLLHCTRNKYCSSSSDLHLLVYDVLSHFDLLVSLRLPNTHAAARHFSNHNENCCATTTKSGILSLLRGQEQWNKKMAMMLHCNCRKPPNSHINPNIRNMLAERYCISIISLLTDLIHVWSGSSVVQQHVQMMLVTCMPSVWVMMRFLDASVGRHRSLLCVGLWQVTRGMMVRVACISQTHVHSFGSL